MKILTIIHTKKQLFYNFLFKNLWTELILLINFDFKSNQIEEIRYTRIIKNL